MERIVFGKASPGMSRVLDYLVGVPAWYLATSVDGQPHVRPFSFAAIDGGRLVMCTARSKDVWEELEKNPLVEATSWLPGHGWLILRGAASLDCPVRGEVREAGWRHLESLGERYEGADDPVLAFFCIEDPRAWICDHESWTPVDL